jgi:hypothetical protein
LLVLLLVLPLAELLMLELATLLARAAVSALQEELLLLLLQQSCSSIDSHALLLLCNSGDRWLAAGSIGMLVLTNCIDFDIRSRQSSYFSGKQKQFRSDRQQ